MFRHPGLVRRAILAGTGPQGADGIRDRDPRIGEVARKTPVELTDFLYLFFQQTPASQAAGRAFIERRARRDIDPDPARSEEHTSELQSLMRISYAVFCLKKKTK